jgi:NAD-dependent SIR2 family protein deacetylase
MEICNDYLSINDPELHLVVFILLPIEEITKRMSEEVIKAATEAIKNADCIYITAGSGMSVDSGLPDFRGGKFAECFPGLNGVDLKDFSPKLVAREPYVTMGYFCEIYSLFSKGTPHAAYRYLYELVRDRGEKNKDFYFLTTTNVDGFFRETFPLDRLQEVHGTMHLLQCADKCSDSLWPVEGFYNAAPFPCPVDERKFAIDPLPLCKNCNKSAVRPNMYLFDDEDHYVKALSDKEEAAYQEWISKIHGNFVLIEIGCGEYVNDLRVAGEELAISFSLRDGCHVTLIRINPNDCNMPESTDTLKCIPIKVSALEALTKIYEQYKK